MNVLSGADRPRVIPNIMLCFHNLLRLPAVLLMCANLFPLLCLGQVSRFGVTIDADDYRDFLSRDMFSNEYVSATVEYQGMIWKDAEFRYKGRSNRYYPKKSYRIKLPKQQLLEGMRDINLHGMYTDRSMVREKLAWDLFALMGETAPGASYAGLSINGQNQGAFVRVDKIDKYFLRKTGKAATSLYNTNGYYSLSDLTAQPEPLLHLYYPKEVGDTTDYSELSDLLGALNNVPDSLFADTLNSLFDMQSIYNWFAGNILMMMGDSYTKNYFLARDSTKPLHQWSVIPWDYDESFGICNDPAKMYPDNLLDEAFAYTFPPSTGMDDVLKVRLFRSPILREALRQHLDTLLHTVFTDEGMHKHIDSLAALVRPLALHDTLKRGTMEDFEEGSDAVKYYVTARRNYLLNTFIHQTLQDNNNVTMAVGKQKGPIHFVEREGRQIATVWVESSSRLDSLTVLVYGDSIPANLNPADTGKCVRRIVQLFPYPARAKFSLKLQFEYEDFGSKDREVGTGVKDERALRPFAVVKKRVIPLKGKVNPASNTVIIDNVTEELCAENSYLYLALP